MIIMIFALSFSVTAWHCVDTDETKPPFINGSYGPWGDNGLLGGNSSGYLDWNVPLPDGCTGTRIDKNGKFYYKNVVCPDSCSEFTLIEFYCDDMPGEYKSTIIKWKYYENSGECGYEEVPEFGLIGATLVIAGALGFLIFRKKN